MSELRKRIKLRLVEREMTQEQLISEIRAKTGMYCDSGLMCKIYAGKAKPASIMSAISEILGIEIPAC